MSVSSTSSLRPHPADNEWANAVSQHCGHMYQLIKEGESSRYVQFLQTVFQLLNNLHFHCLLPSLRTFGVTRYIVTETERQLPEMQALYDAWQVKEAQYLKEYGFDLEKLNGSQTDLRECMRETVFELFFTEQIERAGTRPSEPFISIWDHQGRKNPEYSNFLVNLRRRKSHGKEKRNPLDPKAIEKIEKMYQATMGENGMKKSTKETETGRLSVLEAHYQFLSQDSEAHVEEALLLLEHILYLLKNGETKLSSQAKAQKISKWEGELAQKTEQDKQKKEKRLLDKAVKEMTIQWNAFSKREEDIFESLYEEGFKSLSVQETDLVNAVKRSVYRVIHEEQAAITKKFGPLPFYSIFNPKGELNTRYWVDELDARARKNGEKPFEEYRSLDKFSDYDVVNARYSLQSTQLRGQDARGMRLETGGIIPAFCEKIVNHMGVESGGMIKTAAERLAKPGGASQQSITDKSELYEAIFAGEEFTLEEKMKVFVNAFCQALVNVHYMRGETQKFCALMGDHYQNPSPRLLFQTTEGFESFCSDIQQWLQPLVEPTDNSKKLGGVTLAGEQGVLDEIIGKLGSYPTMLKLIGVELGELGLILTHFSNGLAIEEAKQQSALKRRMTSGAPHSPRMTEKLPRSSSLRGSGERLTGLAVSATSITEDVPRVSPAALMAFAHATSATAIPRLSLSATLKNSPRLAYSPRGSPTETPRHSPRIQSPRMVPEKLLRASKSLLLCQPIFEKISAVIQNDFIMQT